MFTRRIFRGLLVAALTFTLGMTMLATRANAGFPFPGKCLDQTGCSCCFCPACDHCCKLDAEMGEEKIPCFDVESKVICIPRVVFPWQKKKCRSCDSCAGRGCTHCVNNGARTRRICVLKEDSITCPKCKYTWTAERVCNGCDGGCDSCDGGCDDSMPTSWQAAAQVAPGATVEMVDQSNDASAEAAGPAPVHSVPVPQPIARSN